MAASAIFPPTLALPTLDKLGARLPPDAASTLDAPSIARAWFRAFSAALSTHDASAASQLFAPDAYWRDMLAFTWDYRTFHAPAAIATFLSDRLRATAPTDLALDEAAYAPVLERPYDDLAWVQLFFAFRTAAGPASGIARLVPVPVSTSGGKDGEYAWRAHTVYTVLEGLHGAPERVGPLRDHEPNHGLWVDKRRREIECVDEAPRVIVIGGGQSGLEVAARLKYLGVKALVVERQDRVGDQWRGRYEALCLHDPVWYDHMPYIPFPATWPVYTPAVKLGDWLEQYAHALELNVWTSAEVTSIEQDPTSKIWTVYIKRKTADGTTDSRVFRVPHVIFAVGWSGGAPRVPRFPGQDTFRGQVLHSSQHKSARDHLGKRVVVVGACTSGHDIAADYYQHGVDVTMYQRSETYIMSTKHGLRILLDDLYSERAPPTDVADRIFASYPNHVMHLLHQRKTREIAEADRDILEGLERVGFRLGWGHDGSGFLMLAWTRSGGYYLDVGTSKLIADGKIKLKNDAPIERFDEKGLVFTNGTRLDCDVVIFATGYTNVRDPMTRIAGPEVVKKVKPVWGMNAEGELNGAWRDLGVPGLYVMMGNLALCRFNSKLLALQIKAMEDGVFGERYSAKD